MSIKAIVVYTFVSYVLWVICVLQIELKFFAVVELLNCLLASRKEEFHTPLAEESGKFWSSV